MRPACWREDSGWCRSGADAVLELQGETGAFSFRNRCLFLLLTDSGEISEIRLDGGSPHFRKLGLRISDIISCFLSPRPGLRSYPSHSRVRLLTVYCMCLCFSCVSCFFVVVVFVTVPDARVR